MATLTHTFSPTTVLEVIGGTNWAEQDVYPLEQSDWDALDYRNHLPGHRQFFTENNPNHILPNMTFGGANALPNTRDIAIGQGQSFPWLATNDTHNLSVNLTHLRGKHNMKAGFFYERTGRPGPLSSNAGTYNFNSDAANPLDTNLGWANAAARAPQHLHRKQQQPALHAGIQPARVLLPGQLAHVASVHARPRRPLLAHRRRLRPGSGHRLVRSLRLGSGERGGAVAAALRQRRVPLHRREPGGAESGYAAKRARARGSAPSSTGRATSTTGRSSARKSPTPSPTPASRPRRGSGSDGTSSATARRPSAADSARATTASATASTAASPA